MKPIAAVVEGIAFWAPSLPSWQVARAAFRGEGEPVDPPVKRPTADLLPRAEQRRVPDSVALALEVAARAVAEAGRDASTLPSVFTSAHGDLAVSDYMCTTLATTPALISPTKFHNSVHNACAGYWTIGTGCRAASTALTAFDASFAAGLLEALAQVNAEQEAVLLVAFDVQVVGALSSVTTSEGLLAVALVLAPPLPARPEGTALTATLVPGTDRACPPRLLSDAARALEGNASAGALPLFEALAAKSRMPIDFALHDTLSLRVSLSS